MQSLMNGIMPPYTPPSNIVYFHDWRYVDTGQLRWCDRNGETLPLWGDEPASEARLDLNDVPHGIRIEVQPCDIDESPVLTPENLGESAIDCINILHEQGRYRLFYESLPRNFLEFTHKNHCQFVRYAESDDGITWKKPDLGICEFEGSKDNNIVFGGSLTGDIGLHGSSVFYDPSECPADEKYKMLFLGMFNEESLKRYCEKWPDDIDPLSMPPYESSGAPFALYGATSPDGLRWKLVNEPLLIQHSDTANVCTYDRFRRKYVAYLRSWFYGRRTIARSETSDFRHFPSPQQLIWPGPEVEPSQTWYYSGYTTMPDAPDYHIMFANRWSLETDTFTTFLFTSPDGLVWSAVPGGSVARLGTDANWYRGGMGFGSLLHLPKNRIGCMARGAAIPHKYPRRKPLFTQIQGGWVHWPKGRLTALKAEREGAFSLYPLNIAGRKLVLNYRTQPFGYIQIAIDGIKGRTFEDCDPIDGDELDKAITWRGQSDMGFSDGQPVKIRFRMRHADIFSVKFC